MGSPLINNGAVVSTATPANFNIARPEVYRDAAVRTYASANGAGTPASFKIMFR